MEAFMPSSITLPNISYTTFPNCTITTTTTRMTTSSGGGGGSGNSNSGPGDMDSRIWSRLPEKLLDRVIAFLPPPAFFRARSVCKRWYSLLFSHSFLHLYLHLSPPRRNSSYFLFFQHLNHNNNTFSSSSGNGSSGSTEKEKEGYLFDPYDVVWYRLSFSFVPPGFSPVSSSGGLVCWVSDEPGPKTVLLSNPLLLGSSLTPLPSTLRPRLFPSVGLAVRNNSSSSSVDLVVAGDDMISPYAVKNLTSESFHIDGGGFYSIWGTTAALPRLCSLESGRMVYVEGDGRFYGMNYSPYSVLSHEVATNTWCKIQAPMRRFLRSPTLVESRGRLVLVAAVEKSKLNVPKSLRMWGLQYSSSSFNWVEIERMPQQLYLQFAEVEGGRGFDCVGSGEFVVVVVRGTTDKAVMFDFCRKRWVWMPPCPYTTTTNNNNNNNNQMNGFGYEPRLATPVLGLLHQFSTLPFQSF